MSITSATMPFPVRLRSPIQFDPVLLTLFLTLLLGGLVILASRSSGLSTALSVVLATWL